MNIVSNHQYYLSRSFLLSQKGILITLAFVLSLAALTATIFLMNLSNASINEPSAPLANCGITPNELASVGGSMQAIVIQSDGIINGETISMPMILSNAPNGLAGYYVEVSLDNPANARITGVEFPIFGLTRDVSNTGSAIQFAAADLMGVIQSNASDATIATLKVETISEGSTNFHVEAFKLDDDKGDSIQLQVVTGSLTICERRDSLEALLS